MLKWMIVTSGWKASPCPLRQDYPYRKLRLNPGAAFCTQKCPSHLQGSWVHIKESDTACSMPAAQWVPGGREGTPFSPCRLMVGLCLSQEQKYVGEHGRTRGNCNKLTAQWILGTWWYFWQSNWVHSCFIHFKIKHLFPHFFQLLLAVVFFTDLKLCLFILQKNPYLCLNGLGKAQGMLAMQTLRK